MLLGKQIFVQLISGVLNTEIGWFGYFAVILPVDDT